MKFDAVVIGAGAAALAAGALGEQDAEAREAGALKMVLVP